MKLAGLLLKLVLKYLPDAKSLWKIGYGAFQRKLAEDRLERGRTPQDRVKQRLRRLDWARNIDDDETDYDEDDAMVFQLKLPADGQWHTTRVTPVKGYIAIFRDGRFRAQDQPVVAWLTQAKAVGAINAGDVWAETQIVAGIFCDGHLVDAATIEGFEKIEQV